MSTETKAVQHTTSPWIVESGKKFSGDNWLVCTVGRSTEDDLEYYVTTDSVHASELSGDAKYDARLISAAPDMLEALKQLAKITRMYVAPGLTAVDVAIMGAEAAIRKAEGEL